MSFSLISKKFGVLLSKQMMNPAPTTIVVRRSLSASKNTINRHDLAVLIANEHEITVAQSDRIVKSVFDTIVDKVSNQGTVRIADFGAFDSMTAKARDYKPPGLAGGSVHKPETQRPRFKAYDSFKKSVNGTKK